MRILILEDDPVIALDLQMIVEGEGHQAIPVHRCRAATRLHLAGAFDFALLDIDLGDGNSLELATMLNERRIPFAFVSGAKRSELPPGLRDARFIRKPFEESAVVRLLQS